MDEALYAEVVRRLDAAGVDTDTATLVLSAFSGDLDGVLSGETPETPEPREETPREPVGAYLSRVDVQGFRGIGPAASLELAPGPGLTLVVGRNGSGKSSVAEALELLLTGDTFRWAGRTKVWREGWRNLHQPDAAVSATFHLEGAGATRVQRTWEDGASLEDTATEVVRPNEGPRPIDVLGWTDAVHAYRPFLSYAELGSMLDEGPSKLYDALAGVLGLDALVDTQERLRQARLTRERALKEARARLQLLRTTLEETADERASRCLEALAFPVRGVRLRARPRSGRRGLSSETGFSPALYPPPRLWIGGSGLACPSTSSPPDELNVSNRAPRSRPSANPSSLMRCVPRAESRPPSPPRAA